jgi:hypothetical protein
MQKANLNSNVLKNYFAFLIKQGAIEGRYIESEKSVFMITERGLYLTKYFIELNQLIPTGKIPNNDSAIKQRIIMFKMSTKHNNIPQRISR